MNTELFIARRIFFGKENRKNISNRIVNISLIAIAVGLATMIISVAVFVGFKTEIRKKVSGFGAHIQLVNYDSNNSYETKPVSANQPFLDEIRQLPGVAYLQQFATKPGIIQTDHPHGIVLKGIASDFNWSFFQHHLVRGAILSVSDSLPSNKIILSEKVSKLLQLDIGDPVYTYFLNQKSSHPLSRKFIVSGIYRTSLEDFDNLIVLADIRHIQQLNKWAPDEISGFEIVTTDFNDIDDIHWRIRMVVSRHIEEDSTIFKAESILQKYPQIFDWLSLLDMNIWVLLVLITAVAGINMIAGLLVLILEKTNMIGILKALGTRNYSIRKVFIYLSGFLIVKGLIWGNLFGIVICLFQYHFQPITLDPSTYYLDTVPILLNPLHILLINAATMLCIIFMLIIPSHFISKISPDKAIRFD